MTPQANGGGSADDGDGDRDGVRGAVSRGVGIGGGFTLKVDRATRQLDGRTLFSGCSFGLAPREILFISGPSGVGKTLLLRSIACLDDLQGGVLTLNGKTPAQIGFPTWRAQICYVPQSRVNFPGTPAEFYFSAQQFSSQKGRPRADLPALVYEMGLEQVVLNQAWSTLSGGQAQRVAIAIALALCPLVLLLDEPTSALDPFSTRRVERVVRDSGAAAVWVTHDEEQPARVGGRMLELPHMRLVTLPPPPPDRPLPPVAGSAASLCASDPATDT